jgi:hypothetical protein
MLGVLSTAVVSYLLLAQPQSSSSSTAQQLAKLLRWRNAQESVCCCYGKPCMCLGNVVPLDDHDEFAALTTHGDVCEVAYSTWKKWIRLNGTLYKQHTPPTEQNVARLRRVLRETPHGPSIMLLTRNASTSAHSFCGRTIFNSAQRKRDPANVTNVTLTWKYLDMRIEALSSWACAWRRVAAAHPTRFTLFTYEELLVNREAVLRSALSRSRLIVNPSMPLSNSKKHLTNHSDGVEALCKRGASWTFEGSSLSAIPPTFVAGTMQASYRNVIERLSEAAFQLRTKQPRGDLSRLHSDRD